MVPIPHEMAALGMLSLYLPQFLIKPVRPS